MLSKYFENNYCRGIKPKNSHSNLWHSKGFFASEFISVSFSFAGILKLSKGDTNEHAFHITRVEKEKLEALDLKEDQGVW